VPPPRADYTPGPQRRLERSTSTRTRKGSPWLKTALVTAAWAVRAKDTYLQAQFLGLRSRRGAKKAILAVAASMLTAMWHMLKDHVEYPTSVPITSRAATTRNKSSASYVASVTSAARSKSLRRRLKDTQT